MRLGTEEPSSRRAAGRYVLGELLGRGGMAEVFAGHSIGDHGFQKPVAVKRLLPELATDEVFVTRLIEEAKLLVGMAHGNIVSVIDLARDGNDVFLVMEFVDGPSLRQLMKARGSRGIPVGIATYVVQAAAAGLAFAHGRPGGAIIHADISPSNLLLTTSGEVRVADFGIARREGGADGTVEGKWAYMAPEQARGEALTPASDVFALGVVLYELVCGTHPIGLRITANERESRPLRVVPPHVVNPFVSPGLDAICMRALASDPRDRYATMQQLIDALVEERFANHWREGASELAQLIREVQPVVAPVAQPKTAITLLDRPLTIATRSLLRDSGALPPRASAPTFATGTHHDQPRGDVRAVALVPPAELRGKRWPLAVLALGALCGTIAAVAIQLAPSDSIAAVPAAPPAPTERMAAFAAIEVEPPSTATIPPPPVPAVERPASEPTLEPTTPEPTLETAPPAPKRAAARAPTVVARKKVDIKKAEGTLRLNAYPWAWAYVNGKKHEAPTKLALPEGKYTVKLENPENGKHVLRTVVVEGGKTATVKINWEDEE